MCSPRWSAKASLARKTGEGFYQWVDGSPKRDEADYDDAELERLGHELIAPLLAEAQAAEKDGVVADADHVDAGVIFGTGFAPFRGGPLHYRKTRPVAAADGAAA